LRRGVSERRASLASLEAAEALHKQVSLHKQVCGFARGRARLIFAV
jgi:hypothetical protein